jgi:choline dehydrogenase
VDRVIVRNGRAVGVTYLDERGEVHELAAGHVVLAAGAYGTPAILLRSGIGPAAELRALGIDVHADLPVGRRLFDHPGLAFPVSVSPEWARMGWPAYAVVGRGNTHWVIPLAADQEAGVIALAFFAALTDQMDGRISLASRDPRVAPAIHHGYWAATELGVFDGIWDDFRQLMDSEAMRRAGARDPAAGASLRERLQAGLGTGAHPAGGCAIGAVVDPDLNVIGVPGLSVADASVFPSHVTNNPAMTVHVVGEIGAERLRR